MKLSEIEIGKEYLVNRNDGWQANTSGAYRTVVLGKELGHWKRVGNDGYVRSSKSLFMTVYGIRVVTLHRETGAVISKNVINPRHIRGAWEPTWKAVHERIQQVNAVYEKHRTAQQAIENKIGTAVARARQTFGLTDYMVRKSNNGTMIEVSVDVFAQMVEVLDKRGWEYTQTEKEK